MGIGRINVIEFHPSNTNIAYIGSPSGGLWKTENINANPVNWEPLTDYLPHIGVSAIAIDKHKPTVIYIGTGDKNEFGRIQGIGILKSEDAGKTWAYVNNDADGLLKFCTVHELKIDPNDENIIFAATSQGFFKSNNAGMSWEKKMNGLASPDFKIHPSNSEILYLSNHNKVYKSTDAGESWFLMETFTDAGRLEMAVTSANPNYLYVVGGSRDNYAGFFLSTNAGVNFTPQSNSPNILGSADGYNYKCQADYDLAIVVDPDNSDKVYVGGISVWYSEDRGSTWSVKAGQHLEGNLKIHADQHFLKFKTNNSLYICNDGGLYEQKMINILGTTYNYYLNKNGNLHISQIYRLGLSQLVPRTLIGMQDNGTAELKDEWLKVNGGDGMECLYDFENQNTRYFSTQNGFIQRKLDYSASDPVRIASPETGGISDIGAWITPYVLDKTNRNTMYIGYTELWRTNNVRTYNHDDIIWTQISNFSTGQNIRHISQSEKNPNICFVMTNTSLYLCTNFLSTIITFNLIYYDALSNLRDICLDSNDEKTLYISMYNGRVLKSSNVGLSFIDISGSLPNVNINTIAIDKESNSGLYVGTDIGVFYKDNGMNDWIPFNNNLPNVIIYELEIYYDGENSKLRAATFGRGLWQTNLVCRKLETDLNISGTLESSFIQAGSTINSDATIQENKHVIFRAGNEIKLNSGFYVEKGAIFEAITLPCSDK